MSTIPKKIYQSWKTLDLPPKMREAVDRVKELNPEYEHELWDDKMCYEFLRDNFGENYANAFDVLIPGAFKCDLWRYAILYVYGGVYMDIDMIPLVPFNQIIEEGDKFVSVRDINLPILKSQNGIFQAFIACEPKHPILLYSLELAFSNIANRFYEINGNVSVTGPIVVGIAYNLYKEQYKTHENIKVGKFNDGIKILYFHFFGRIIKDLKDKPIIKNKYEGYISTPYSNTEYYKDISKTFIKKIIVFTFLILLFLLVLAVVLFFIFKKKFNKCEEVCLR